MRYPKGSLQLSQSRDLPLLRQLLRSEFVTHSQLFRFMQLNHHERSRHSFDWRVRRLLERELIRRQTLPTIAGEYLYSIAAPGQVFPYNLVPVVVICWSAVGAVLYYYYRAKSPAKIAAIGSFVSDGESMPPAAAAAARIADYASRPTSERKHRQ